MQAIRVSSVPWPDLAAIPTDSPAEPKPGAPPQPAIGALPPTAELVPCWGFVWATAHVQRTPPPRADWKALATRWHPDRFIQKFGARIAPDERDAVLAKVTEVAAQINVLRARQEASA